MNRADIRERLIDRLHHSHLGGYGWIADTTEMLGCLLVGHRGFDEAPDLCRHCGQNIAVPATGEPQW